MPTFFPSIYIIVALYISALYFFTRFEFWIKEFYKETNYIGAKRYKRHAKYCLSLFIVFVVLAFALTVVDCYNSAFDWAVTVE